MRRYKFVGKSTGSDHAYGKVTGQIEYCSDMRASGMLFLKYKQSSISHGMISSIDTSDAWLPGVKAVYTYENTPNTYFDRGRVSAAELEYSQNQERLFDREVRFYGERVAAVVADDPETAEKACRLIKVEYEELPKLLTMADTMKDDAPSLHENGSGNVYPAKGEPYCQEYGDYESVKGEHSFKSESHISRMTHMCMETQAARAKFDRGTGKLTVWTGTQTVYGVRSTVADFLGLSYNKVRVVKAVMGGSFGVKQEMILEPLVAYAAYDLKADVLCHFTREEQVTGTLLRHNFDTVTESKVDSDGTVRGVKIHMDLDAGAYQTISPSYLRTAGGKIGKTYVIPNIKFTGYSICTTTPVNGSFRSWGSSEEAIALEPHWNMVAEELGMDPIDFRLKNIREPYDTDVLHGASICNTHFREVLTEGRERFAWDSMKEECRKRNSKGGRYRYGVGVALCSHTTSFYPYMFELASVTIRLQDDGSVILHAPIHDHGCGATVAMRKIVAEILEIDMDKITVLEGDTQNMPYDYGCYASRTTFVFGLAVKKASEELLEQIKQSAALMLGCLPNTIIYSDGICMSEPDPEKKVSLKDVWEYSIFTLSKDLMVTLSNNAKANPGTPAAHFSMVRVDTFNGHVKIEKALSVHDIGKAINPDMVKGQIESGVQQGMGWALCEEIKIDPGSGKTLISNFKNYEIANAADMPDVDILLIEDPEPEGPFGAKGVGEVATSPVAPAIIAAVNNALGTRLTHFPLTPPVILEGIENKRKAEALK